MNISTTDAQPLLTKEIVARFSDRVKPKAFGRSFFRDVETATKEISVMVQRQHQFVAVDVIRGYKGNRNTFSKSSEKILVPPYYNENFDMTQLDLYDALYNEKEISAANFGRFLDSATAMLDSLMDKIDRRYELQAWQALLDGIVQLEQGINLDFGRKAASLVDLGGGNYWTGAAVDPNDALLDGCTFLKETGKMEGHVVNAILGDDVLMAYLNNTIVKDRAKQVQWGLDAVVPAQRDALGRTYHGEISVASYRVRLWSYPDTYESSANTHVKYMNTKKVVMLPEVTANVLAYAAVPQLLTRGQAPQKGKFLVYDHIDELATAHLIGVKSAGAAVPVAIDQAYTFQAVA